MRQSIIGLGERSLKKNYYPELQKQIRQLEQTNETLLKEINERKKAEEQKKKMESQLRQVQKMQAIGTLAGGIAHYFNNILAAIIGSTELAILHTNEEGISPKSKVNDDFEGILKSSDRAKELIRRLLSFSRQHEGIQLIHRLRDCRPEIPIILCTGFSDIINEMTIRDIDYAGYIMKPVIRSDLAAAIRKLLDSA